MTEIQKLIKQVEELDQRVKQLENWRHVLLIQHMKKKGISRSQPNTNSKERT